MRCTVSFRRHCVTQKRSETEVVVLASTTMESTWLAALALSLCIAACATEGSGAAGTPPAIDASLGDGFLGAACDPCIAEKCAVELRTCDVDPACHALRSCRAACTDVACDDRCLAEHDPDAGARRYLDRVALCAEYNCASACAGPPASDEQVSECQQRFDESISGLSVACGAQRDCACQNCNREWRECLADPLCTERLECALRQCTGASEPCASTCFSRSPLAARRAAFCAEHQCGACGAGDQ